MINLVIDIGNTFSKLALFNNRALISVKQISDISATDITQLLSDSKIDNAIISSVRADIDELEDILKSNTNYTHFTASTPSAVFNQYKTPHTLGLDRYAAVIGAQAIHSNKNCLVIDAGTCITYDLVTSEKNYVGGSISPGINMRFKAMHSFTDKLPLVEPAWLLEDDYGTDTLNSMRTGVQKGVIFETLGFINNYYAKWPELTVILCGGDVNFFDTQLKNSIFAHALKTEPNLVLIGLNEVIHFNND